MTTATDRPGMGTLVHDDRSTALGNVLVATDGTESSDGAVRAAAMYARHSGASVTVLAVTEGLPLVAADYGILIPPIDEPPARRAALLERVRTELQKLRLETGGWAIEVREGDPAATIGETALQTLRHARTPVLAVPPQFDRPPRRAVIATDFTVASVAAARTALSLFDSLDQVYLVHVSPALELQPDAVAAWMAVFGEGITPAFERVTAEIGAPDSVAVETVTRTGKASREILQFAREKEADLIVTGNRGAGLVERVLVGSTATGIIRGAQCAVLAVPAPRSDQRLAWPDAGTRVAFEGNRWAEELDAFTKRNVGRLASLEVDDPEIGAQAQEHGYPLLGVTWDHHDERVEIMVGDFDGTGRHLTRGIGGVTEIDLLSDKAGRDWILRIAHPPGQTILTLKR
jgi:nucleotide-binding universal stress UspA family protein